MLEVSAERVQRWRSSGDVAAARGGAVRFTFDADGSIATIDLS